MFQPDLSKHSHDKLQAEHFKIKASAFFIGGLILSSVVGIISGYKTKDLKIGLAVGVFLSLLVMIISIYFYKKYRRDIAIDHNELDLDKSVADNIKPHQPSDEPSLSVTDNTSDSQDTLIDNLNARFSSLSLEIDKIQSIQELVSQGVKNSNNNEVCALLSGQVTAVANNVNTLSCYYAFKFHNKNKKYEYQLDCTSLIDDRFTPVIDFTTEVRLFIYMCQIDDQENIITNQMSAASRTKNTYFHTRWKRLIKGDWCNRNRSYPEELGNIQRSFSNILNKLPKIEKNIDTLIKLHKVKENDTQVFQLEKKNERQERRETLDYEERQRQRRDLWKAAQNGCLPGITEKRLHELYPEEKEFKEAVNKAIQFGIAFFDPEDKKALKQRTQEYRELKPLLM